jgi:hypothetical protein
MVTQIKKVISANWKPKNTSSTTTLSNRVKIIIIISTRCLLITKFIHSDIHDEKGSAKAKNGKEKVKPLARNYRVY